MCPCKANSSNHRRCPSISLFSHSKLTSEPALCSLQNKGGLYHAPDRLKRHVTPYSSPTHSLVKSSSSMLTPSSLIRLSALQTLVVEGGAQSYTLAAAVSKCCCTEHATHSTLTTNPGNVLTQVRKTLCPVMIESMKRVYLFNDIFCLFFVV